MNISASHIFFLLFLFSFSQNVLGKNFVEGVDYQVLKGDSQYRDSIVEFFSYSCPFCYRAESVYNDLKSEVSDKVLLVKIPVHFGRNKYKVPAYAWFLIKELGLDENVHKNIFDLTHVPVASEWSFNRLSQMDDLKDYFLAIGVPEKKYDEALRKITKLGLVDAANDIAKSHKVGSTPTFLVRGKYLVSGLKEGPNGEAELKELLKYLVEL